MLINSITEIIGQTPLLRLEPGLHGLKNIELYAKLELLNPFGSVKDKSAWMVLKDNLDEIVAKKQTVIESSSGNMAKAIQMLCSMRGIPFLTVTNRIKIQEVKQILKLIGAEIDELPGLSECPDPNDPNDPISLINQMMSAEPEKYFHTSQYTNHKNIEAHYFMTGKEIHDDLNKVDFFIGGLGTTGSTRGAGKYLKEQNPDLKIIGVIAAKGDLLPGVRNVDEMHEVGLFERSFYDEIVEVNTDQSIDGMMALIKNAGVLAGPTGGASYSGALNYLKKIDEKLERTHHAVFVVCDRMESYLSYLQKHRPSLFGITKKASALKSMDDEQILAAPSLTVNEASEVLAQQKDNMTVVDLRGALAFKAAHIAGSINIPPHLFEEMCDQGVPISRQSNVLLVCPVGDQSRRFAAYLHSSGVRAYSLEGGMAAWQAAGKPCERSSVRTLAGKR